MDNKRSLDWAKTTKDARTDTLVGLIRKQASNGNILHKQDLVNARNKFSGTLYSLNSNGTRTQMAIGQELVDELRKANKAEWEKNNDGKLYDFMKMPLVLQFINAPKTTKKRALPGYRPLGAHSLWDLYT